MHTNEEPTTDFAPTFYLTQRLTRRVRAGAKGFDGEFGCQYMGSAEFEWGALAEFEWGALPESLARMRQARRRLTVHVGRVQRGDVTAPVFVVGHRDCVAAVPDALTAWMVDPYPRGKEMTYFPEHVDRSVKDYQAATHAWWSLTDDVMWALDADTADLLLKAVRDA